MKTTVDKIYSNVKTLVLYKKIEFTEDRNENFGILDKVLHTENLIKGGLRDLENDLPGGVTYLAYLLQSKEGINFGLCKNIKMWFNKAGFQYRCQREETAIPVNCFGVLSKCSRPSIKLK